MPDPGFEVRLKGKLAMASLQKGFGIESNIGSMTAKEIVPQMQALAELDDSVLEGWSVRRGVTNFVPYGTKNGRSKRRGFCSVRNKVCHASQVLGEVIHCSSSRQPQSDPTIDFLLEDGQRQATRFQDSGVELANVEARAQRFFRPGSQFANLE